jgi:aarF domain-containing kinase
MPSLHLLRLLRNRPILVATSVGVSGIYGHSLKTEWEAEKMLEEFSSSQNLQKLSNIDIPQLPREYDRREIERFWEERPVTVARRFMSISAELTPILWAYIRDFKLFPSETEGSKLSQEELNLQRLHAANLRSALTALGPAFVKIGQQLSIRPDILPPGALAELQKLCDNVTPVPDEIALTLLKDELGFETIDDIYETFDNIHLVASASLGQVYKATVRKTREEIALKIQRPDMTRNVSLDLFLINKYGEFVDYLTDIFTKQQPFHKAFIDCFAHGSYQELDYENEAKNQEFFKSEFLKRKSKVHVPSVYRQFTSRRVLATEWVNGVKLADAPKEKIRELIPDGVELFLTQMLDIGAMHCDPHPGNLYVTNNDTLCLLDFGLCADIDKKSRVAITTAIIHLLSGDFDTLIAKDVKDLGFLPHDLDTSELKPIMKKILTEGLLESGSNLHTRKRKLMDISNELNEVFFHYPFSVPPFFALITRGLGLLEGIALSGDPEFDIFQASYPYAKRRAIEIFGTHGLGLLRRNTSKV